MIRAFNGWHSIEWSYSHCRNCLGKGTTFEIDRFSHEYIEILCRRCLGCGYEPMSINKRWQAEAAYIASDIAAASSESDGAE